MAAVNKTSNEYAELITNYDQIPKAVLAAIAVSFIVNQGGVAANEEDTTAAIMQEWTTLHAQGFVPQKPVKIK